MRSIQIFSMIILSPLLAGLMLVGLIRAAPKGKALSSASSDRMVDSSRQIEAAGHEASALPVIRPSLLISIPYGFASTFPLQANGQQVLVTGHGSCSIGGTFSVAVTVTHDTTGNMARGDLVETCAGESTLQEWQLTATAVGDPLTVGPAETCGLVQIDDGDTITDQQEWCVDVKLGDYVFLPVIVK
jgi:hypothetical protein